MLTKGGLNAITMSLASEYAKNNIRFNAVAPGAVDTPLVKAIPKDFLMTLSPMGAISEAKGPAMGFWASEAVRLVTLPPVPCDSICATASWVIKKKPSRLVETRLRKSSAV
jgi:NAD(P)-dependent dehydrogenase (short-subunit alcohol dehydrogenase family)